MMRWKCERNGCFEQSKRCRLGKLDHLFPGNNGMTDVDAYCHLEGSRLFLEWKSGDADAGGSQLAALKALSHDATLVVAWGDPLEMLPTKFDVYRDGRLVTKVRDGDVAAKFDLFIAGWAREAVVEVAA